MRIEEILQTTLKPLTEAMRMTSEMKRIADSSIGEFRFGIEYEFHVDQEHVDEYEDNNDESDHIPDEAYAIGMVNLEYYFMLMGRIFESIAERIPRGYFSDFINSYYDGEVTDFQENEMEEKLEHLISNFIILSSNMRTFRVNATLSNLPNGIKDASIIDFELIDDFSSYTARKINEQRVDNFSLEKSIDTLELYETSINRIIEQVYENGFENLTVEQISERLTEDIMDQVTTNQDVEDYMRSFESNLENEEKSDNQKRIDFIEQKIANAGIDQHIEKVVLDGSVEDGVEVITEPLPLPQTVQVMDTIFDMIDDYGGTSQKTGMHVNISHSSFAQGQTPDPLKIAALMDVEYFQGRSNGGIVKYGIRNYMVQSTFDILNIFMLERLAEVYIKGGIQAVEEELKNEVIDSNKFRDINWTSLLQNFNASERRIEFRFFGGAGYEDRKNEILNDLKYIMAVIKVVSSNQYNPQDYYKGIVKILDRAVKRGIQKLGDSYDGKVDDFSSLIRFVKKVRS